MATNLYRKREPAGHKLTFVPLMPRNQTSAITEAVFKHQEGVYDTDRFKNTKIKFKNNKFDKIQKIWALFYNKYYSDNPIHYGPEIDALNKISPDAFYETITSEPNMPLNSIFFLLGKIGCGKTTFINNMLAKKAKEWFNDKALLFIRVSAYGVPIGTQYSYKHLLNKLIDKIQYILSSDETKATLRQKIDNFGERLENFKLSRHTSDISKKETALIEFLDSIRVAGFQILLVIDNLDYIFHVDDKTLFTSDAYHEIHAFENVIRLIRLFEDKGKLARLRMNVLITLRPDTYKYLSDRYLRENLSELPNIAYDQHCYTLDAPDIKTVVKNRLLMAAELVKRVSLGEKANLDEILEPLKIFFTCKKTAVKNQLMNFFIDISFHGLRDIVSFCRKYCWIKSTTAQHEPGLDRFTNHFYAGSVAFLINGHARYSQEYSQFPNIYSPAQFSDLKPTYLWFKRLVLQYIYHYGSMDPRATITPEAIFNCFVAKKQGYPGTFVRETLNELTKRDASYLTSVELKHRNGKCGIHKIFLTLRGWACLTRNIFESFLYLQLVIDDFDLPILKDKFIWKSFAYLDQDYRYLIAAHSKYTKTLLPFLREKAKQVFLFSQILKYSLKFEQDKFPQVFENLKQEGIPLINIDDTRTRNIDQIATVMTYIKFHAKRQSGNPTKKGYRHEFNKIKKQVIQIDRECENIGKTIICQIYGVTP